MSEIIWKVRRQHGGTKGLVCVGFIQACALRVYGPTSLKQAHLLTVGQDLEKRCNLQEFSVAHQGHLQAHTSLL